MAKKHLKDTDKEPLEDRIDEMLRKLQDTEDKLRESGYPKTSKFITKNVRFMVTFAELALEGLEISYTTNKIEWLMEEVSKRCKNKWMHWSTEGLKNLIIVFVRYTDQPLYQQFKNAYIRNRPLTK